MHDNNDNRIWENKKQDLNAALSSDPFSHIDCHSSKIVHLVSSCDHVTSNQWQIYIDLDATLWNHVKYTFKRDLWFWKLNVFLISLLLLYFTFFLDIATFLKLQEGGRLRLCRILFSFSEIYYVKNPYVLENIRFSFCFCVWSMLICFLKRVCSGG